MKKKREIDWDYIIRLSITWVALLALLVGMSLAIFSCSVAFIKGHDNTVNDTEKVDASGEELELLGEHNKTKKVKDDANYDEGVVSDTLAVDTVVKDTLTIDNTVVKDTIEDD